MLELVYPDDSGLLEAPGKDGGHELRVPGLHAGLAANLNLVSQGFYPRYDKASMKLDKITY